MKKSWQKLFIIFLVFMMCVSVVAVFSFTPSDAQAANTLLHEFAGGADDGSGAWDRLELSSGVLYGMTSHGGDSGKGVVYSINTDGSDFTLLHEFAGGGNDGEGPRGSLIKDDGVLYGMTLNGGDGSVLNTGTIFKINIDGTGFVLLHEFAGGANDGQYPYGSLVLDSGVLYGMTNQGGDSGKGVVFSIETDGSNFTLLHEFAGGGSDGDSPTGSLLLDAGVLYGMTIDGGDDDAGVVFSIETDGSNFTLLHEFTGQPDGGESPQRDLVLNSGTLYSMTYLGGSSDKGIIFSIDTDGSDFSVLHNFNGGTNDGDTPYGSLIYDTGNLYGMTSAGGTTDNGIVFAIEPDGTNFTIIHNFAGGASDGSGPFNSLVSDADSLYGLTLSGGDSNLGTIFSMEKIVTFDELTYVSASVPTTLTFTATPVISGTPCPNSGGNADFSTTGSSVNFGNYTGGEDRLGCQEIAVTTNATDGYVTTMQIDQALTNSTSDEMDAFAGSSGSANTWTTPEVWTSPVAPNDSYFGWTTDDTTDYPKFGSSKYAAFVANETPYEVATESGPVVAETNYITFRLEVGANQEAGIYTGSVMYITTATY